MERGQGDRAERDDEALVERARAGDQDALEELFDRYRNQVYSLAYRMTGSPTDAEDLCQDVFLQVIRKIGSFRGQAAFSTWLYRVTMNRSRDFLRRRKRSPEMLGTHEEQVEMAADPGHGTGSGSPESRAISGEAQVLVQGALMQLPVSLRAPLVLHDIEGYQYSAIAGMLRLPVGTVKSRIFRGRQRLAGILEPHKEQWR